MDSENYLEAALVPTLRAPAEERTMAVAPEQFEQIVQQNQRRVYRVIYLLLRDHDAAETLSQECFLKVYRGLPDFRGDCRLDTWILRIAVNLARDHAKSRRLSFWKRLVGLDSEPQNGRIEHPDLQPSPERVLLAREQLESVWAAVETLSQQQRAIFLLRFSEEMSLAEIADILGLRIGSVKAQLFRAMSAVRKKVKEQPWR
jgi:RNA polymerase sigma-70 factor (ECF subfamily)